MGGTCDGLNEKGSYRFIFEFLVPSMVGLLGRIRRYGHVGGSVLLGLGFGMLKDSGHFELSLSASCLYISM